VIEEAIKKIKDLGYEVPISKGTYPVLGMTCASCANSAETIIRNQPGVVKSSVNFGTGNLMVEYLPNLTNEKSLQKAVQGVGYDLLIEEESNQQETLEGIHAQKLKNLQQKTIWAVLFSIPLVIIGMFFMNMPYGNEI